MDRPRISEMAERWMGFSDLNLELTPKRLELLCELVPQAAEIALLVNPDSATGAAQIIKFAQGAALVKGLQLAVVKASSESEIEAAFTQLHADVLLVHPEPFFGTRRDQFVALPAKHALPTIYWNRRWVAAGGLISYGADIDALSRQAGIYARRILEGAKPADLPVQQADDLQAGRQSEDRRGARPNRSAIDPCPADEVIE
jgi:putative ABC transport system substrate-binding protein